MDIQGSGIAAHFGLLLVLQEFFLYTAYMVGRSWTLCFSRSQGVCLFTFLDRLLV